MLASFFNLGSFSYTSRAGFIFIWGVSRTYPVIPSFLSGEFLLQVPYCFFFFFFFFFNLRNFSSTSQAGFLSANWEFLLHIPCWLNLYLGTLSYTLHASFICLSVSLTHPMHAFFKSGEFLLHMAFYFLFF